MIIPRRVRRRLLLPPGWVALGFLLLLGCLALQPWQRQLKQWNALQITMVPLKADTSYVRFLKEHEEYRRQMDDYNPYVTPLSSTAVSTLDRMRPWRNVAFSGNDLTDSLSAATTESAIRKIIADTSHAGGVRVRFLPGATYANLVKALDIMNYTNQKKYFLDIHHRPVTLYAITDKPLVKKTSAILMNSCMLCGDVIISSPLPVKPTMYHLIIKLKQELKSLKEHNWRLSILLLVVISSLSLWRLVYHQLN